VGVIIFRCFWQHFDQAEMRHTASMRRWTLITCKGSYSKLPANVSAISASGGLFNSLMVLAVVVLAPALELALELELSSVGRCGHKYLGLPSRGCSA
jgi:hypothetical protein